MQRSANVPNLKSLSPCIWLSKLMNYNDVHNVTTEILLDVRLVIKQKCHIGKMCEIESRG